MKGELSYSLTGELLFEEEVVKLHLERVDGVINVCGESSSVRDSSELKREESLNAYLTGFGMLNWVESRNYVNVGTKVVLSGLDDFFERVL